MRGTVFFAMCFCAHPKKLQGIGTQKRACGWMQNIRLQTPIHRGLPSLRTGYARKIESSRLSWLHGMQHRVHVLFLVCIPTGRIMFGTGQVHGLDRKEQTT